MFRLPIHDISLFFRYLSNQVVKNLDYCTKYTSVADMIAKIANKLPAFICPINKKTCLSEYF